MEGRGFEVASGVHRIEAPLGERIVACHLVVGSDAALLVDTGVDATPAGSILPYAASIGLDPARIGWVFVTHCDVDHMGGNAAFRELVPTAVFVAHDDDADLIEDVDRIVDERYSEFAAGHGIDIDDAMKSWCHEAARPTPVDLRVRGVRESIRLGVDRTVELVATPGHSPGSLSVWDPSGRALIVGDAVLGSTVRYADGRPAFPPTYRDPRDYRWTISGLERFHARFLLTSHDPVFEGESVAAYLDESRAFAVRLEHEALRELRAGGQRTTRDLIEVLAPRVGEWDRSAWPFLANELVGHLEELEADGVVGRSSGPDGLVGWEIAS